MPRQHRVATGECLSAIAFRYGLIPETIWDCPQNDTLRRERPNMHQLLPGDELFIPDLRPHTEAASTNQRHRFRVLNTPEKLKIRFHDEEAHPRADVPYRLQVDGRQYRGRTDSDGRLEVFIPPDAALAVLVLEGAQGPEEYELALGEDHPKPHTADLIEMLRHSGFLGEATDNSTVIDALRAYQAAHGLEITGDADLATTMSLRRNRLKSMRGE